MEKPTAILDKSFLQEVLLPQYANLWDSLDSQYQLLFPFVIVEETLSNITMPDAVTGIIRSMADLLFQRKDWILEDTLETVFRELITGTPEKHPQNPPQEILNQVFAIRRDSIELLEWLRERKIGKQESAKQWAQLQQEMFRNFPEGTLSVNSEQEYADRLRATFNHILQNSENLKTYLDTVIGRPFSERYEQDADSISRALSTFTSETFQFFPATVNLLFVRLVYVTIPRVRVKGELLVKGQKWRDQVNNFEDEQYICSAMPFRYLITRDRDMMNVMRTIKQAGLFGGSILYWEKSSPLTLETMQAI